MLLATIAVGQERRDIHTQGKDNRIQLTKQNEDLTGDRILASERGALPLTADKTNGKSLWCFKG